LKCKLIIIKYKYKYAYYKLNFRFFASEVYEEEKYKLYKNYLFVKKGVVINTSNITSYLEQAFSLVGVNSLTISEYRHVVIALMEKHLRIDTELLKKNDLYDEQAGHSHSMAVSKYAISQYDTRVATRDAIQEYYKCSIKWQELLGKLVFII
jgi:integrase